MRTRFVLTRREQLHQSRIVEHLQSLDGAYPGFADQLGRLTHSAPDSTTTIAANFQLTLQQITLLSYLDPFKAMGVIFLLLLPLLLLVKRGRASEQRGEAA